MQLPEVSSWLIDGFNVLHAVLLGGRDRSRWWTALHRRALVDRVCRFEGSAERVIVFDGRRAPDTRERPDDPGVRVEFEPDADAFILKVARRASKEGAGAGTVGVVTADRKLRDRCRHAGAEVVSPAEFLAHCPDPASGPNAASPVLRDGEGER